MKFLAHRGFVNSASSENSLEALSNAVSCGFGFETDLRDLEGEIAISHDPALSGCLLLSEVINSLEVPTSQMFALNIKADGLASKLDCMLPDNWKQNVFFFDMSVPDMTAYLQRDLKVFSRLSEIEPVPTLLSKCSGIWVDSFFSDWFSTELLREYLDSGLKVAVVSPELHKRNHLPLWEQLASLSLSEDLFLCTDFPDVAKEYFFVD